MSIATKIYLQDNNNLIRRFQLRGDETFEEFERTVRAAFNLQNGTVNWQYKDDEDDWVSFSSQSEWKDALFYHKESGSKLLRLKLSPQQQQQEQSTPFRRPHGRCGRWANSNAQTVRHWGIICDGCDQKGIVGKRFKCQDCDDFDFCETCFNNAGKMKAHGNHNFTTIEKPVHRGGPHHHGHGGPHGRCPRFRSFQDGNDTVFHCPIDRDFLSQFGAREGQDQQKTVEEALNSMLGQFGVDVQITTEEPKPQEQQQEQQQQQQQEQQPEPVPVEEPAPVVVEQPKPVEPAPVVIEEPQVVDPFATQLETLKMMGFENATLNRHLLTNYQGDITRVVNSLLQLTSFKQ